MAKKGKKYQQVAALVNPELQYTLEEACDLVKKTSTTTFDASVDIDIRLGVDPRHATRWFVELFLCLMAAGKRFVFLL